MATQLFMVDAAPDTHRGTNSANLRGTSVGWTPKTLRTSRGTGVALSGVATITGPTPGLDQTPSTIIAEPLEFISPPVAADVTISGTITANLWAFETNMTDNVAINVVIEIIRANVLGTANSNTLVEIVRSTNAVELALTTAAVNNFTTGMTSGGYSSQTLNRGDRLRVRVFADDSAAATMATGGTSSFRYSGATPAANGDSYVTFTEDITFEAAAETVSTIDYLPGGASGAAINGTGGANAELAQSFVSPATGTLRYVRLRLYKSNLPTDNLVIEIQSDSSGSPSGTVVGTVATIAGSTLTTTATEYSYSCAVSLTTATTYWIVARRSGALDTTNRYLWHSLAGYSGGASSVRGAGGTWASDSSDRVFGVSVGVPGSTVYLTDTASAVATASVDREAWTSRGAGVQTDVVNTAAGWTAPIQLTDTAGGTVVDWFTKPLTAFTLTGMAVANLRALESNAAANASLRCQVARVEGDGTSPTVWADWAVAPLTTDNGELGTTEAARTANVSGDDLAITDGQRLRIRVYADDMSSAAMATANTVTFYYAGTSGGASGDTFITFPQTLTEFASGPFTYTKAGWAMMDGDGFGLSSFTSGSAPGPAFRRQRRASRFLTSR